MNLEENIESLFNQLKDRRFGRDNIARNQIRQHFNFVPIEQRYQILRRLLVGNSLDRYIGYDCMEKEWVDTYMQFVEEMWVKFHDVRCARLICRYFPIEYIKEHLSDLASVLKLTVDDEKKCFSLSGQSNSENISVAIIANLKDKQNSIELRKMLYEIIKNYVDNYWWLEDSLRMKESLRIYKIAKGKHSFTIQYISGVSQILESMHHMGFQDAMVEFHKFDSTNQITLLNNLWGLPMDLHPSKEEWIECWEWFLEIVQHNVIKQYNSIVEENVPKEEQQELIHETNIILPEEQIENKIEALKKMQENNPTLKKLKKAFDLTLPLR